MKVFPFLLQSTILLVASWFQPTTPTLTPSNYPPGKEALYYGFFFDETTASSIKNISDTYFDACLQTPEFKTFMDSALANSGVTDPHKYFIKPLDPNEQNYDPLYHVTTKYCGDEDCSSYRNGVAQPHINSDFVMHLVGYYFTNRTFGVRIQLTPEQEVLFDNNGKRGDSQEYPGFVVIETTTLHGITLENIPQNFTPTRNRAHITYGAAPNISAVVTGFDLEEIINFENNPGIIPTTNVSIVLDGEGQGDLKGTGATVVHYFGGDTFGEAFVIYPSVKVLATAKFQPYLKPVNSGASNNTSVLAILLTLLVFAMFAEFIG